MLLTVFQPLVQLGLFLGYDIIDASRLQSFDKLRQGFGGSSTPNRSAVSYLLTTLLQAVTWFITGVLSHWNPRAGLATAPSVKV